MLTKEYIQNELERLDEKSVRNRHGLIRSDKTRYANLINAMRYLELRESFDAIETEFKERQ